MRRKRNGSLTLIFSIILGLSSILPAQELRIGIPGKSLNYFTLDLAREKGFFRDEGLDLKTIIVRCDIALKALLTGDIDAAGCMASAVGAIATQNVPLKTVVVTYKNSTFYIMAKPEIKTGADLKGKIVGISGFGAESHTAMKVFAKLHGLDPEKDIKPIVLGSTSSNRLAALKGGSVDATPLSPPFNIFGEQMGFNNLAYVGDFLEFPTGGYVVSESILQSNRALAKKFIRGTLRGHKFLLENRLDTVRFLAKDYKLSEPVADKVYTSILAGLAEDGTATEKGLRTMVETLTITLKKELNVPPARLVDYNLLKEVQAELGLSPRLR